MSTCLGSVTQRSGAHFPSTPCHQMTVRHRVGIVARLRKALTAGVLAIGLTACGGEGTTATPIIIDQGKITVFAGIPGNPGATDGGGESAQFAALQGITTDNVGNFYVADSGGAGTLRKITPTGVVSTLLSGLTLPATLNLRATTIIGLGYLPRTSEIVYTNMWMYVVTPKIPSAGVMKQTFIPPYSPLFDIVVPGTRPTEMAVDVSGNVYVALGEYIRKLDPAGVVTTVAGMVGNPQANIFPIAGSADGIGTTAGFDGAFGIAVDASDNVFVADSNNKTVRKISPTGLVTTLAGLVGQAGTADGTGSAARFTHPRRLTVDKAGNVYVVDTSNTNNNPFAPDTGNSTIRKISSSGVVTTIAGQSGGGIGTTTSGPLPGKLANLRAITVGADGALYVNTVDAVLKIALPVN